MEEDKDIKKLNEDEATREREIFEHYQKKLEGVTEGIDTKEQIAAIEQCRKDEVLTMSLEYHMQCQLRRSEAEWERKQQFSKLQAVSNELKTPIFAETTKYTSL